MIYKCMRRFVNECVTVTVINGTWNVRVLVIHSTEEEMMVGYYHNLQRAMYVSSKFE
jgi:hypothetical protein